MTQVALSTSIRSSGSLQITPDKTKKPGHICLRDRPSLSDLASSSLAGFFRQYSAQSVHAHLTHRFDFCYFGTATNRRLSVYPAFRGLLSLRRLYLDHILLSPASNGGYVVGIQSTTTVWKPGEAPKKRQRAKATPDGLANCCNSMRSINRLQSKTEQSLPKAALSRMGWSGKSKLDGRSQ